ncbi:MAG: alginate lyase family protein, partial [Bacteroidota bacterium]
MSGKFRKALVIVLSLTVLAATGCIFSHVYAEAQAPVKPGIWSSAAELAEVPMSGPGWEAVKKVADSVSPAQALVSNQDSNNNVAILAAGIVYARTGVQSYKDKVAAACEKLAGGGKPTGRTLAWARETGAYAMAADLVGYRTPAFETWLRNMAEVYVAEDGRTMKGTFLERPNNWGTMAFGSLAAIYAYLGDTKALAELRDYWVKCVTGPNPGSIYGSDLSWHADPKNPRLINPKDAVKEGLNIDGFVPDDMRRGGSFKNPPNYTGYAWETLQGLVMGARVLARQGMSIWDVDDKALYRAAYAIQVRLGGTDAAWKAEGDDRWMLAFLDKV